MIKLKPEYKLTPLLSQVTSIHSDKSCKIISKGLADVTKTKITFEKQFLTQDLYVSAQRKLLLNTCVYTSEAYIDASFYGKSILLKYTIYICAISVKHYF